MTDITERLRKWSISADAVSASDLMDEAAKEIEWLRQNRNHWMRTAAAFDDHLATLRVMLMEQPGGDKDTPSQQLLAAYQLGIRHRDPPDQVRNGAVESRETVQLTDSEREATAQVVAQTATSCGLTDAEREAVEWAVFEFDGVRPDNGKAAARAATLRGLLERMRATNKTDGYVE